LAVLLILVPYGIIWYVAFYAFAKLTEYSQEIKGYPDGKAFSKITTGMGVLVFGLVLPTAITLILSNIASHHHGFKSTSVIIGNYLAILVVIITFAYISSGTRLLITAVKQRPALWGMRIFALFYIALSVIFTYLVITYHLKHPHVYYLNTALLIATIIIPYLFGWFMALYSAYEFGIYARHAKGLLYRRALRLLSYGIAVAIAGSVAIQFLSNTFLAANARHSLGYALAVDYILLVIIAAGLSMVALGTKKLKKFEEV
jgi:hypothetical protein